ncbi:YciI family protein [Thalassovita sp.]|uniref:YciI family protein n=1 Tax=Thalassovita sp. TaxID=1979401 RepID=UPI002881794D|nr:YciI family protein [Thalassovita sp.]MDF1802143.1 YciI family protein [Thalassovita sp.]
MYISLIARDKPGALEIRKANRAEHLAYIESTGIVAQAGPLLDDDEQMVGSLVILDVETMSDAENWAANDPYAKAGLFANVELIRWKKVIG